MQIVARNLSQSLAQLAQYYPVVTVTGPRQSGKTTLCQAAFPRHRYVSLEPLDVRDRARSDPRGFLGELGGGAVLDEIQNVPELLSYLHAEVDRDASPGRFVLTGSQHFALSQAISQSLAGRTAVLTLLPLTLGELRRFESAPAELLEVLWSGGYPRIHDRRIPAGRWHADYVSTYVERDVRQVTRVADLESFATFLRHCAGCTAREVNLSDLGGAAGVSHNTARAWLSVLETSHICFRVPAWHANFKKRLVKSPKLHFVDSGLVCHLLGIHEPEQLRHHPLRGAVFESWVAAEIRKTRLHQGLPAPLFHYRESRGLEVDLILDLGQHLSLIETKTSSTTASDFLQPLKELKSRLATQRDPSEIRNVLIYGGETAQRRAHGDVVPWSSLDAETWV